MEIFEEGLAGHGVQCRLFVDGLGMVVGYNRGLWESKGWVCGRRVVGGCGELAAYSERNEVAI